MRSIHLIPTDKPSRLIKNNLGYGIVSDPWKEFDINLIQAQFQNIYITDNSEIKDCWILNTRTNEVYFLNGFYGIQPESKKIILTTDQDLIKDGVQSIDEEFLEWFVKNPSCEEVEVDKILLGKVEGTTMSVSKYKIIIPQEKPKQLTDLEIAIKLEEIEREEPKQEALVEKMIPLQLKYNLDNMKQKAIEEAAKSYRSSTANKMAIEEVAFQEGAKSDAAKDYWYKKFWEDYESQFKNQEDGND
jgi:hypothetical protein